MPSISTEDAIRNALTSARLGTFESATKVTPTLTGALALYAWNAQVAAAMLAPLHICEVVIRNAVADAIAYVAKKNPEAAPVVKQAAPQKAAVTA